MIFDLESGPSQCLLREEQERMLYRQAAKLEFITGSRPTEFSFIRTGRPHIF